MYIYIARKCWNTKNIFFCWSPLSFSSSPWTNTDLSTSLRRWTHGVHVCNTVLQFPQKPVTQMQASNKNGIWIILQATLRAAQFDTLGGKWIKLTWTGDSNGWALRIPKTCLKLHPTHKTMGNPIQTSRETSQLQVNWDWTTHHGQWSVGEFNPSSISDSAVQPSEAAVRTNWEASPATSCAGAAGTRHGGAKHRIFRGLALHKDRSLGVPLWSQKLDVGGNASPKLATPKSLAKWIKRGHQGNHLESEKEDSMTNWSIGSKSSNSWKYFSQKNELVFQSHSSPRSCVAAARHSQRRHIKPRSTWPGIAPVML